MDNFDYALVKNPECFKINVIPAHSDHIAGATPAEARAQESSFRVSLNGVWRFHYAKNYGQTVAGFEKNEYNSDGWDRIRVPAHIQLEGYDTPVYVNTQYPWDGHEDVLPPDLPEKFNPVASYIKYFELPAGWEWKPVFISFEGVESGFALWLNGAFVGYSEDTFSTSEFDLTPYVRPGVNKLAVQVFKWTASSWLEDQDFFRFSGIFRDVWLFTKPAVHLEDLRVRATLDDDYKDGRLELTMKLTAAGGSVAYTLEKDGTTVLTGIAPCLPPEEEPETAADGVQAPAEYVPAAVALVTATVEGPDRWSAEDPQLYDLTLEVRDEDGTPLEYVCEKVGFRRFEMKDGLMLINGRRIVFNGVNRHEFSCLNGRRVTEEEVRNDVILMKRHNINAVRTSHYPDACWLYRLCDEYGVYMIAETNLETHGLWNRYMRGQDPLEKLVPGDRQEYLGMLLDRANDNFAANKNHPAVLIWSVGNESFGGSVIMEMTNFLHRVDPDRLVHYESCVHDPRYPDITDMYSQMYTPAAGVEQYLKEHKEKPFILCEYTHSMGNSNGAMHKYTDLAKREMRYQGGFIWDYVDQTLLKKNRFGEEFMAYGGDHDERPTDYDFSANGILTAEHKPYGKIQEVKFNYQGLAAFVEGSAVRIVNYNLFTNSAAFDCLVTVEKEGCLLERKPLLTDVPAGEERTYALPVSRQTAPGEYAVTVSFRLREDTLWAERGYEVAFGQGTYRVEGKPATHKGLFFKVLPCSDNIGVSGDDFEIVFGGARGGLVSYRYAGVELIDTVPRVNFWRAMTQNDTGNRLGARYGIWKLASLYESHLPVEMTSFEEMYRYPIVDQGEDFISLTWRRCLPTRPETFCLVTYTVYPDGTVRVSMDCTPGEGLPPMPEFGMLFKMKADYDRVTWYGYGPEENYCDRCRGARLGVYKRQVKDMMEPYIVPQECGNRTGVRWAAVTDRRGRGLRFEAEEPMDFSALPYTPEQLEEAQHPYELPPVHRTVIRCSMKQMGIAGDDTWGARTHEEYLLPAGERLHFAFSFKGI